jgi:hypothetical protein
MTRRRPKNRTGGIYIAVLGTAMIIALLGMSALIGQRLQNRMLSAATDMRQAQLNANSAVELALLTMKQDTNWRTTYSNGNWFTNRGSGSGSGTCTLNVTDPVDGNLANSGDDPVTILGIGYSGDAQQRVKVTVDPRKEPLTCLRSAVAVGDTLTVQATLRANNALITANQSAASTAQIYGNVEASSISGATYNGTTTTVTSDKRPVMPDWTTVFNYYRTNGTQIDINSLPTQLPNLGQNVGIESGSTDWTGTPPSTPTANVDQNNNQVHSGSNALRVRNRTASTAGAAQYIDSFIKPGQQYTITCWVYVPGVALLKNFRVSIVAKAVNDVVQQNSGTDASILSLGWRQISTTVTAPSWSGNLEYAFVKIAGADALNTSDFWFDDFTIRETTTGRFIYRQVISPSLNPFGATNAEGIYWINCNNSKLVIERSRILGTLLVINPGPNSCVANGPIAWEPAVAGYPALLVDADVPDNADFLINCTNRVLSEKENSVNFNPTGAAHDEFGVDADMNDTYHSGIRGLIAIRDDLTTQYRSLIRGQVIVGDDMTVSANECEVEYLTDSLLNPPPGFTAPYTYYRRPASAQKAVAP